MNILRGICLIGAGTLIACSSSEGDWKKADTQGTIASYQKFLTDHPSDSHAEEARNRVHSLEDEQAWTLARTGNTLDSFKQYIQTQPSGAHSADAREQIAGFERAAAWKTLQASATAPALQEFLQKYSQGPEADQARAQLQKLNAEQYRVQLGTFRGSIVTATPSTRSPGGNIKQCSTEPNPLEAESAKPSPLRSTAQAELLL